MTQILMITQKITNWFRNRLKDWANWGIVLPNDASELPATQPPAAATTAPERRNKKKATVNPLFKKLQSRAPAASALWAKANKALVDEAWAQGKHEVGDRQHLVATMYDALSDEEHAYWEDQVAKQVAEVRDNPDAPYM